MYLILEREYFVGVKFFNEYELVEDLDVGCSIIWEVVRSLVMCNILEVR